MKKASPKSIDNDVRPEHDLTQLKGGIRGKYYQQASAGANLVLIEPELARVFPDTDSVNRALKLLVDTASAAAPRRRRKAPNRQLKRTACEPARSACGTCRPHEGLLGCLGGHSATDMSSVICHHI
jgi:hypothetical protein